MSFSFLPTLLADSPVRLTPPVLANMGVRLLMLDFDNTIVPYTTNIPTPEMAAWLTSVRDSHIAMCVISNSKKPRVVRFCEKYGLDCITGSKKPFSRGIRVCLKKYAADVRDCMLVGDQIFTDILGANCAGIRSVLVPSIHNHTVLLKLRHVAELPFIYAARKRRKKL